MSKINISIDCVVFGFDNDNKLKVLLIKQVGDAAQFALPGDLLGEKEELDIASSRILKSLTSLDNLYMRQFHVFGNPERVSFTKDRKWLITNRKHPEERVITIGYFALVKMENYNPKPSSFAFSVKWVDIHQIPELAFDHNMIIEKALLHLKDKINYEITSELLPEKFTLTQLQLLYEVILNQKLDKRNFRKSIERKGVIKATKEKQIGVAHKRAEFYKFI
tara:strand:- start:1117 stop:1779 length:663 start_codon:yes stop_codon:yes gene_type:complete